MVKMGKAGSSPSDNFSLTIQQVSKYHYFMKALVTGATGFIGSHLIGELIKRGYSVTCLVRRTSETKWLDGLEADRLCGDCGDRESLRGLIKGFDYIFHLAGLTKAASSGDFHIINAKGTENIIDAALCENPGIRRFIYISSLAAVGPSLNGKPVDESTEPHPVSEYGKSKLGGEAAVLRHKHSIPVTIIRPPAVYGPRDKDFHILFKLARKGIFPDTGRCLYSLIHVDDLVRGIVDAAESQEAEGKVFFLSDGNAYTNEDIASAIASAVGKKTLRLRIPVSAISLIAGFAEKFGSKKSIINRDKLRELSYANWTCDSSGARKALGFSAKIKLKDGMKWTADWYRIHRWL
jgi:nucleoside-diphosphate-sugar epimerase